MNKSGEVLNFSHYIFKKLNIFEKMYCVKKCIYFLYVFCSKQSPPPQMRMYAFVLGNHFCPSFKDDIHVYQYIVVKHVKYHTL
jgi:hypothetical protein